MYVILFSMASPSEPQQLPYIMKSHLVPNYAIGGLGYIRFLAPPEKVLRWIEGKLNLLGRLPHYVSVDQKTYGRYGVLPSTSNGGPAEHMSPIGLAWVGGSNASGGGQRLGP